MRLFLLVVIFVSGFVSAKEKVVWYEYHAPPAYFTSGEHKGMGHSQMIRKGIIDRLPEYEHVVIDASVKRVLHDLKNNEMLSASPGLLKTPEREKYLYYSVPKLPIPTYGILVRSSLVELYKPYLTSKGQVDLRKLIESQPVKIFIQDGSAYGETLDEIIKEYEGTDKIVRMGPNSGSTEPTLVKREWDIALGTPFNVTHNYYKDRKKISLTYYPIKDSKPYMIGYVVVQKNIKGKILLDKIDEILLNEDFFKAQAELIVNWQEGIVSTSYNDIIKDFREKHLEPARKAFQSK